MEYQVPLSYTTRKTPVARPVSAFGVPRDGLTPVSSAPPSAPFITPGQLPAFQPAPTRLSKFPENLSAPVDDVECEDDRDLKASKQSQTRVANLLTVCGALLLILIVLTPVWDSVRLLYSSTFVYFEGRSTPSSVIAVSVFMVLFFIVAMQTAERCGPRGDGKTTNRFLVLFTSMIMIYGMSLLILPSSLMSRTAYNELMFNCKVGASTGPLYDYYHVLLDLRVKPDCIKEDSIEKCSGFQERYPYTGFLKSMELGYTCSGFCYASNSTVSSTTQPTAAVLIQHGRKGIAVKRSSDRDATHLIEAIQRRSKKFGRSGRHQNRQETHGVVLLSANGSVSKTVAVWDEVPEGRGNTVDNMVATGWMDAYPPTLFTNANYKATCEGSAARELRFSAIESGSLMFLEGSALFIVSVVIGFIKLCSMCRRTEQAEQNPDGEGQYQQYPKAKVILT